tara:strand:- start:51 stop:635 length:585 start_codon:yes stop_codon:yes gene_type:complete
MINSKKFVNLPKKYKSLLERSATCFSREDIKNIAKNSISYESSTKIYNDINKIMNELDCNSYDMDNILKNYNKKNTMVEILKKFVNVRNKQIAVNASKTGYWNENLKELVSRTKGNFKDKISLDLMEKAYINLLQDYKNDWKGYWTSMNLDKMGKVKSINIFDTDDYDKIQKYIGKEKNWRMKNESEIERLKNL